eukprot:scaffold170017_cov44-Prasinocladus_malaysianus.AAC.2
MAASRFGASCWDHLSFFCTTLMPAPGYCVPSQNSGDKWGLPCQLPDAHCHHHHHHHYAAAASVGWSPVMGRPPGRSRNNGGSVALRAAGACRS